MRRFGLAGGADRGDLPLANFVGLRVILNDAVPAIARQY